MATGAFVFFGWSHYSESEARTKETRKLTLVNLERLVDLWIEHYKKLDESDRTILPLKPVHYLAPAD